MKITELSQLDLNGTYTYADYLTWHFKERIELLRGRITLMSPAPGMYHQKISGNLHGILWSFLRNQSCQVFSAPFDVRLPRVSKGSEEVIYTVVQPDISVICDESKLDEQGCIGAPDLVVEVLCPSNSRKEMKDKFDLYEEAGVQEYWLVDPTHRSLTRYVSNSEATFIGMRPLTDEDVFVTDLFPGLQVDMKEVFG
ncbi:MAG: Uma2 family endonuclease [Bacteroidota bacterium]